MCRKRRLIIQPDSLVSVSKKVEAMDVDLYISGEGIDWEIADYKDAGGFGLNKCMMQLACSQVRRKKAKHVNQRFS